MINNRHKVAHALIIADLLKENESKDVETK